MTFRYRLHDTTGDDLGVIEHPAPNVEPGDVVMLADGQEALVTCRVEADGGPLAAMLEVAVAPEVADTSEVSAVQDGEQVESIRHGLPLQVALVLSPSVVVLPRRKVCDLRPHPACNEERWL